jgi:hypothetical protein
MLLADLTPCFFRYTRCQVGATAGDNRAVLAAGERKDEPRERWCRPCWATSRQNPGDKSVRAAGLDVFLPGFFLCSSPRSARLGFELTISSTFGGLVWVPAPRSPMPGSRFWGRSDALGGAEGILGGGADAAGVTAKQTWIGCDAELCYGPAVRGTLSQFGASCNAPAVLGWGKARWCQGVRCSRRGGGDQKTLRKGRNGEHSDVRG